MYIVSGTSTVGIVSFDYYASSLEKIMKPRIGTLDRFFFPARCCWLLFVSDSVAGRPD
jgi:hypothetical protein